MKYIVILFSLIIFSTSCNRAPHLHDENEAIVLNEGQKWKVDADMLAIIRSMESEINNYTDTIDFEQLSLLLSQGVDSLTTNCTMTGQAHDELHKWLLPYIDLVNETKKASKKEEQTEVMEKLRTSFGTFNMYFE